ncbi:hypothetical protein PG991_010491 [Apiospora marii]|uniref:Uncharacterized protein n=1 Tax=Apiospora marii TaxID=335849 RepID=A0ABR1RJR3_9PEZI
MAESLSAKHGTNDYTKEPEEEMLEARNVNHARRLAGLHHGLTESLHQQSDVPCSHHGYVSAPKRGNRPKTPNSRGETAPGNYPGSGAQHRSRIIAHIDGSKTRQPGFVQLHDGEKDDAYPYQDGRGIAATAVHCP